MSFSYKLDDASAIVPEVLALIGIPNSVVDVGGGIGVWCSVFKKHGVSHVLCIDNKTATEKECLIESDEFFRHDLNSSMPTVTTCDLIVCLEVVEHLPSHMSEKVVDFLSSSAPIILFSAAIPGQPGNGHINCHPPTYWRKLFEEREFVMCDVIRPKILYNPSISYWYKQNLFLFINKRESNRFAPLIESVQFIPDDFELVHKKILRKYRSDLGVKSIMREMPRAIRRAIHRWVVKK